MKRAAIESSDIHHIIGGLILFALFITITTVSVFTIYEKGVEMSTIEAGQEWVDHPPDNPFKEGNNITYTVLAVSNAYVQYSITTSNNTKKITASSTIINFVLTKQKKGGKK